MSLAPPSQALLARRSLTSLSSRCQKHRGPLGGFQRRGHAGTVGVRHGNPAVLGGQVHHRARDRPGLGRNYPSGLPLNLEEFGQEIAQAPFQVKDGYMSVVPVETTEEIDYQSMDTMPGR